MKICKILGYEVDANRIVNPVLRKVIEKQFRNKFVFAYGDKHTDTDNPHTDNTLGGDHSDVDYNCHIDNYNDYRVYGDHSDYGSSGSD